MNKENKIDQILLENKMSFQIDKINAEIKKILENASKEKTLENLKLIYNCIDATSLGSTDSKESISQFVQNTINNKEDIEELPSVAAICVYPSQIENVKEVLTSNIPIASVAGGFPSAQTFIEVKIAEVALAIASGAEEIDVVIDLGRFLDEDYEGVVEDLKEIKFACKDAKLKVILETGALKDMDAIYNASLLAIESGANFIKTSTGKGYPGASLDAVYAMSKAILTYKKKSGNLVGLKVSGGVSSIEDAINYFTLIKTLLGHEFMSNKHFRVGTSSLCSVLENEILKLSK